VAALSGLSVTCGAAPNAAAKVIMANVPPVARPVPVVTVIVPAVSSPPVIPTVGAVQAAVPAAIVGVVTAWQVVLCTIHIGL
jgi:hypothetical protein